MTGSGNPPVRVPPDVRERLLALRRTGTRETVGDVIARILKYYEDREVLELVPGPP